MLSGAERDRSHAISAPPPKLKKLRKKLDAANAIDRPNTIWIRRRKPPLLSPNAKVRPVTMMTITATIFATGPWTDSSTCCSGCSQGMPDPAACAAGEIARVRPMAAPTRRQEPRDGILARSEEHTSELQSLMRTSYAVFCLKKKKNKK